MTGPSVAPAPDRVVLGLVAIGAALRLRAFTSGRSLWDDELALALNLRDRDLATLLTEPLALTQSASPGYLVLARGAVVALGPTDPAVRLVPLLVSLVALVLAVVVARAWLTTRVARWTLVGLVAVAPSLAYYAGEAKPYAVDVAATLAVLAALGRRERPRGTAVLALTGAVAALVSLPAVLVLGAAGIVLVAWRPRPAVRDLVVIGGAWGVGTVLHAVHALGAGMDPAVMRAWWAARDGFPVLPPGSVGEAGWLARAVLGVAHLASVERVAAEPGAAMLVTGPAAVGLALAALALAAGAVVALWGRHRAVAVPAVALVVAVGAATVRAYPLAGRLALWLVPLAALAAAAGVDVLAGGTARTGGTVRGLAPALAAAVLVVPSAVALAAAVRPADQEDAREAFARVRAGATAGDVAILEAGTAKAVDWYGEDALGPARIAFVRWPEDGAAGLAAAVAPATGPAIDGRVWVVATDRVERADAMVAALIDGGWVEASRHEATATRVVLLEAP